MSAAATSFTVDGSLYWRRPLCQMRWDLDCALDACASAVQHAGGPIALLAGHGAALGTYMRVFSGTGEALSAWEWHYGRVRMLHWTAATEIACVLESGRVMLWSLHGTCTASFALFDAGDEQTVLRCEAFEEGAVFITSALRPCVLQSFASKKVLALAEPHLTSPPTAMTVLKSSSSSASLSATAGGAGGGAKWACPEVVLATASRTVLVVDDKGAHDQLLTSGPFVHLAVSPNGKFIAAFSADGALQVLSSDFSRHLSQIDTRSTTPPRALVWCGVDAILLLVRNLPESAALRRLLSPSLAFARLRSPSLAFSRLLSPPLASPRLLTRGAVPKSPSSATAS